MQVWFRKRRAGELTKVNETAIWIKVLIISGMSVLIFAFAGLFEKAEAEYGDVVMNEYSDEAGMRPVVFPHWFHRIRFRCKVCHGDLGFKFEAGANDVNMVKIIDGQYCGACHNGDVAWSIENCDLCHAGLPATSTQVHNSTSLKVLSTPDERPEGESDAPEGEIP
jgi:c(7)-type cytochrome triheme protein